MRPSAVLLTALLLAGCGSGGQSTDAGVPVHRLCVVTSLPTRGPDAAAGRGVLAGVTQVLRGGVRIGDAELTLCDQLPDAPQSGRAAAGTVAANASSRAATAPQTVAFIGELTPANAEIAATILRGEGVPMITPAAPSTVRAGQAASNAATIYLQPSGSAQLDAEQGVLIDDNCVRTGGRTRPHCLLTEAPFCTGLAAVTHAIRRYCVAPGPDLSKWPTPAQAYGYTAAQLLVAALRTVSTAGDDPADRGADARALLALTPTGTPLGAVRVRRNGTLSLDTISLYDVNTRGGVAFDQVLRSH